MVNPFVEVTPRHQQRAQQHLVDKNRMLFLRGGIVPYPVRQDQWSPMAVGDAIMTLNSLDNKKPIYVFIDSPGGDIPTGWTLFDIMKMSKAPVITVAENCASMATILMQAGAERTCLPHSAMMLHLPQTVISGDIEEVKIRQEVIEKTMAELVKTYIEAGVTTGMAPSKQTFKAIKKKLLIDIDREYWLDGAEAIEYGLVDRLVTTEELNQ